MDPVLSALLFAVVGSVAAGVLAWALARGGNVRVDPVSPPGAPGHPALRIRLDALMVRPVSPDEPWLGVGGDSTDDPRHQRVLPANAQYRTRDVLVGHDIYAAERRRQVDRYQRTSASDAAVRSALRSGTDE